MPKCFHVGISAKNPKMAEIIFRIFRLLVDFSDKDETFKSAVSMSRSFRGSSHMTQRQMSCTPLTKPDLDESRCPVMATTRESEPGVFLVATSSNPDGTSIISSSRYKSGISANMHKFSSCNEKVVETIQEIGRRMTNETNDPIDIIYLFQRL